MSESAPLKVSDIFQDYLDTYRQWFGVLDEGWVEKIQRATEQFSEIQEIIETYIDQYRELGIC